MARDYTVKEAAALLGVPTGTLCQRCIRHKIGKLRGNTRLLTAADIERLKKVGRTPKKSAD